MKKIIIGIFITSICFTSIVYGALNSIDAMAAYLCKKQKISKENCVYSNSKYYTGSHTSVYVWDSENSKCYTGDFYNDDKINVRFLSWAHSEDACSDF